MNDKPSGDKPEKKRKAKPASADPAPVAEPVPPVGETAPAAAVPASVPAEPKPAPAPKPQKAAKAPEPAEDDDEDDDEEDDDEDEFESDREEPVAYSAAEAVGAISALIQFVKPFIAKHRAGVFLVLIGVLIETAFNVLMPVALKYLIDEVFEDGDVRQLTTILVILGAAGLLTSFVAIWYEWQDAKVTAVIITDVRRSLFDHIQKLPIAFYHRIKKGEILSRFSNDMVAFEQAIINMAKWGALPLFELLAGVVLLIFLNWQLGLVALLVFPLALIGPRYITPRAVEASFQVKRAEAGELAVVQENVGAQTVVKAFGLQKISAGWFGERNAMLRQAQQRSTFLNTLVERSITITVLWLHLAILAAGAYLTFNGHITVGTFVAFESVFWEITYNLNHLTQYIPVTIDAAGAVRHINMLMHEPIRVSDKPDAVALPRIQNDISFNHVAFSYDGKERQLHDLNLTIKAGTRVAIVGPSGAGKSTILNMLLRMYDPESGSVTIDGVNIADVTRESLRDQMAVVFQDNVLFSTSYRENIRLGRPDATDEEVIAAAKQAEIHKFITALPQGYDTQVGERGETLSGGQRQRMAIARALVRNPAILLLDEATSALDQTTEAAINKTLHKVAKDRTVIFVTHRLNSIKDMEDIVVMSHGDVVQRGSHAEMIGKPGAYRDLWKDYA